MFPIHFSYYKRNPIALVKRECSVFKKKIIMDENDAFSEYKKIPLSHNRTNGAVYSKVCLFDHRLFVLCK